MCIIIIVLKKCWENNPSLSNTTRLGFFVLLLLWKKESGQSERLKCNQMNRHFGRTERKKKTSRGEWRTAVRFDYKNKTDESSRIQNTWTTWPGDSHHHWRELACHRRSTEKTRNFLSFLFRLFFATWFLFNNWHFQQLADFLRPRAAAVHLNNS